MGTDKQIDGCSMQMRLQRYIEGVRWQDGSSEVADMHRVDDLSVKLRQEKVCWGRWGR